MTRWEQHPNRKTLAGGYSMEAVAGRTGEESVSDLRSALKEDSQPWPSPVCSSLAAA